MIRGTFANIRLRNQLLDGVSGGYTRDFTQDGGAAGVHLRRRAATTRAQGIPLVVLGGKEYGSGSSRDWAAKGTALLGVRAVIVESYERIHRSNLIGMGVLPLQFPAGETAESLGLDGTETFDITGVTALNDGSHAADRAGDGHQGGAARRSSSTRWCASTPPARPTTTATAGSCSTCCAACCVADPTGGADGSPPHLLTAGARIFRAPAVLGPCLDEVAHLVEAGRSGQWTMVDSVASLIH